MVLELKNSHWVLDVVAECANLGTDIVHMALSSLSQDVVDPERKIFVLRMYTTVL